MAPTQMPRVTWLSVIDGHQRTVLGFAVSAYTVSSHGSWPMRPGVRGLTILPSHQQSSPSVGDLDRFLDDLGGRRNRLLRLVGDGDAEPGLVEEIEALGEQLITAEEELRVQQAELVETQRRLEQLVSERVALLEVSADAYLMTDDHGVTLRFNRHADDLLRRPAGRMARRPLTSWFDGEDRRVIRTMITNLRDGQGQVEAHVRVAPVKGEPVPVHLMAAAVRDPHLPRTVFRWRLVREDMSTRGRQPGPLQLVAQLTAFAEALMATRSELEVLQDLLAAVVAQVPAVVAADGTLVVRGSKVEPVEATFEASHHPAGAPAGVMTQVRFGGGRSAAGVLTLHLGDDATFTETDDMVVQAFAAQAVVALRRLADEMHWRQAVDSRQHIGEAVGLLVERHRLTAEAAFERLKTASQHKNVRLRVLARAVVETGQDPDDITHL
jgi:PAS domain-containing protein